MLSPEGAPLDNPYDTHLFYIPFVVRPLSLEFLLPQKVYSMIGRNVKGKILSLLDEVFANLPPKVINY